MREYGKGKRERKSLKGKLDFAQIRRFKVGVYIGREPKCGLQIGAKCLVEKYPPANHRLIRLISLNECCSICLRFLVKGTAIDDFQCNSKWS